MHATFLTLRRDLEIVSTRFSRNLTSLKEKGDSNASSPEVSQTQQHFSDPLVQEQVDALVQKMS